MARQGGLGKGLQEVLASVPPAPDPTGGPDGVVVPWGPAGHGRSPAVPRKKQDEQRKQRKGKAKKNQGKKNQGKKDKPEKKAGKKAKAKKKAEKDQASG